ncbi:hypothetical protein ACHAWF_004469 [Thalassiosira exigua]
MDSSPAPISDGSPYPIHYQVDTLKQYTAENWRKVGATLCQSRVLTHLDLSSCKLTKELADAFIGGCGACSWPALKVVNLSYNKHGYKVLKAFHPMLKSKSALDTLELRGCNLGINGAKLVADVLNHATINNLFLSSHSFKDQGLDIILSARNARHLVRLCVSGCDRRKEFSDRGYESMAQFVRNATKLKVLSFDRHPVNDRVDATNQLFVDLISRDSILEAITLSWSWRYSSLPAELNDHFLNLVCNTSNVITLCSSNHLFCGFDVWGSGSPRNNLDREKYPKLSLAFDINAQSVSGSGAIRRKMRNFYFETNEFDVKSFNEMDVALMPYILDLVTMTEMQEDKRRLHRKPRLVPNDNLNAIYRLLRNCSLSELFSFPSTQTLLRQKDERIRQLEGGNESMKQRLKQLMRANEQLRRAEPNLPNKRVKTADMESRIAALEADVDMLKQKSL